LDQNKCSSKIEVQKSSHNLNLQTSDGLLEHFSRSVGAKSKTQFKISTQQSTCLQCENCNSAGLTWFLYQIKY